MTELAPLLLLTRPQAASEGFAVALRDRGARFQAIVSPVLEIRPIGPLPDSEGVAGLIVTSAQGVAAWRALGGRTDLPVFAVGDATARAARSEGMEARSASGDADALVAMLTAMRPDGRLLHLRGTYSRGAVADRLRAAGLRVDEAVIYDQPERDPTEAARAVLAGERPVVAPLFSPRSAAILGKWPIKAPLLVAAMSEAVVKAFPTTHIRGLRVASHPDSGAMLDATAELLGLAAGLEAEPGRV
ncbi:uroporphyrinogen-III synthase [Thetidibacter halocola]|uniref:Uroporphyrinogen-III synthase n=1 Tax=Thetidibacter halocola TaxID=2827239 RepID=A0A8J8B7P9_9RHOB|nr:uroporphyrinogen-III synthase [Thetidibacter halocola]MBS0123780.1 uroporphyrinogen-III synthase [Thetidibacter halocola]